MILRRAIRLTQAGHLLLGLAFALTAAAASLHAQSPFSSNEKFLPPEQAFRLEVVRGGSDFIARWKIADQYYLYRDKIRIASPTGDATAQIPAGTLIKDEFFGETQVFRHLVEVPFRADGTQVKITYQGCADAGLCYSPTSEQIDLAQLTTMPSQAATSATAVSEQFRILQYLKDSNLIAITLVFLGFGLLLAFTPCVLPMIPILSGIITGGNRTLTRGKAFTLSLGYVLGMAVTYSLLGVLIGLTGESLQIWFQQPWIIGLFSAVFVLLALSMFGFYELQLPVAVQTRLSVWSRHSQDADHPALTGAVVMGGLSALIVGPCTTAPLVGALLFIAQTGDALVGGIALFSLAIGIGIPLLIIGTSLGKLLPKPGVMLDTVKTAFALLLLGVAVWLLDRIVSTSVTLLLAGALLVLTAVYLYQLARLRTAAGATSLGGNLLTQGIAILVLLYGATFVVGGISGGTSLVRPLSHFVTAANAPATQQHTLDFKPVRSLPDLQREIALAEQFGQPVMLDFYADWCVPCKEMEAFTFTDAKVQTALADTVLLRADISAGNQDDKALLKHFSLFGPPAILFFDAHGYEFKSARVAGYMNAGEFTRHLEQVFAVRNI